MSPTPLIPPKGVFVPSPTFFLPASAGASHKIPQAPVDTETQINHSIFLANAGITGITILGSTGEAVHLSRSERSDLVSSVRRGLDKAGFSDYPLMAGVLTNGELEDTLQWLEDYAKAGAQWGLVLTPGYFGPAVPQQGLVEWYTLIADRSPIPILVYNYPGVTNGVQVLPETYRALANHPNIVGCKMWVPVPPDRRREMGACDMSLANGMKTGRMVTSRITFRCPSTRQSTTTSSACTVASATSLVPSSRLVPLVSLTGWPPSTPRPWSSS